MTLITPRPSPAAPARGEGPWARFLKEAPPQTTEECLRRIAALGKQVAGYVEFMCRTGSLGGTSAEARDQAVAAFCERLAILERELAQIHEDLRLG
jgi:hypothetical protein